MSKRRKHKRIDKDNKEASILTLVASVLNLVTALIMLFEKLLK